MGVFLGFPEFLAEVIAVSGLPLVHRKRAVGDARGHGARKVESGVPVILRALGVKGAFRGPDGRGADGGRGCPRVSLGRERNT